MGMKNLEDYYMRKLQGLLQVK